MELSKKFLTVFAVVALLVAAMAGAAFASTGQAASNDVSNLAASDDAGTYLANVSIDAAADNTLYIGNVYYVGEALDEITLRVSVDFQGGFANTGEVVSADIADSAYAIEITDGIQSSTADTPDTMAFEYIISSGDLAQRFVIKDIGVWDEGNDAVSGDHAVSLDITPVEVTASVTTTTGEGVLEIPGNAVSTDAFEASIDLSAITGYETHNFGENGVLLFVDGVEVSEDYPINAGGSTGGIIVSHDFNGTATFIVSNDGPGAEMANPIEFEFRLAGAAQDSATINDGLIAGISDDVTDAANLLTSFTVAVTQASPTTTAGEPSIDIAERYDYILGAPFETSFDVTAISCEITGLSVTVDDYGPTALADEVSVDYDEAGDLVFSLEEGVTDITVSGEVLYNLEFAVTREDNGQPDTVNVPFTLTATADEFTENGTAVIELSENEYNYLIGSPFKKSYPVTITPTDSEVTDVVAAMGDGSTAALFDQVSVSYDKAAKALVFDVAQGVDNVDEAGAVSYDLSFVVSQDGVLLALEKVNVVPFILTASAGYIKDDGPKDIYGAKGSEMRVEMNVTYDPADLDIEGETFTVSVTPNGGSAVTSKDAVTWNGVTVAFDAENKKYTINGTPENGGEAIVSVASSNTDIDVDLTHNLMIAEETHNVTSGIQVEGEAGTVMLLGEPSRVTFPLRSADVSLDVPNNPWLQVTGPGGFYNKPNVTVSGVRARAETTLTGGAYNKQTGIMSVLITPEEEGDYNFDAFYINNDGDLVMERATLTAGEETAYTSDSGCDAGFGAFALLGLAGVAAILRKKD